MRLLSQDEIRENNGMLVWVDLAWVGKSGWCEIDTSDEMLVGLGGFEDYPFAWLGMSDFNVYDPEKEAQSNE